ncbi:putative GTPase activating protein for Arf-domain-containing protein [Naematelia encephala]|uniref:Putative GTPase activating protein for Arf-domain-containing protein n=1 Tax=Naematelia encephala TaxID=71784 RepID=A0A1Y2BM76_9TREE|nr:putative GTPase activating protein for Arf-domain-containing protein [Naematelia encephala]
MAPRWASVNLGIFLCVGCASIHRKLGTHKSRVKSVTLDTWTREQITTMRQIGNTASNQIYNPDEHLHPPPSNTIHSERDSEIEKYIRRKYEQGAFKPSAATSRFAAPTSLNRAREAQGRGGGGGSGGLENRRNPELNDVLIQKKTVNRPFQTAERDLPALPFSASVGGGGGGIGARERPRSANRMREAQLIEVGGGTSSTLPLQINRQTSNWAQGQGLFTPQQQQQQQPSPQQSQQSGLSNSNSPFVQNTSPFAAYQNANSLAVQPNGGTRQYLSPSSIGSNAFGQSPSSYQQNSQFQTLPNTTFQQPQTQSQPYQPQSQQQQHPQNQPQQQSSSFQSLSPFQQRQTGGYQPSSSFQQPPSFQQPSPFFQQSSSFQQQQQQPSSTSFQQPSSTSFQQPTSSSLQQQSSSFQQPSSLSTQTQFNQPQPASYQSSFLHQQPSYPTQSFTTNSTNFTNPQNQQQNQQQQQRLQQQLQHQLQAQRAINQLNGIGNYQETNPFMQGGGGGGGVQQYQQQGGGMGMGPINGGIMWGFPSGM